MLVENEHVEATYDLGFRMRADHLERGTDCLRVMHVHARDERVSITAGDHYRSVVIPVEQKLRRFAKAQAFPLATTPEIVRVLIATMRSRRIFDTNVGERNSCLPRDPRDVLWIAKKNRLGNSFIDDELSSTYDLGLFALREHDAARVTDSAIDDSAHD